MNRFFSLIILVKLFLVLFIANAYAVKGQAEIYKVTMKKVELCTGSTSVTDCQNAVTIGSALVTVDIASVSAGAAAASYGDAAKLPLGETYTHLRVTIDRKFQIRSTSTGIDTGAHADTSSCVTIATTDAMYKTGDGQGGEVSKRFSFKPVWADLQKPI